ncbi:MAG: BatA domain-containing protein [SAR324 cluster bacterium]|nr:BatA domain-containing protein [SAR324 cluster bacterium]
MLQFLTPLWLMALPLAVIPWFLPVVRQPKRNSFLFSAFFLLPVQSHPRRFLFSLDEMLLKLLRSLVVILVCMILARPYWKEKESIFTTWLIDDTFSRALSGNDNNLFQSLTNLDPSMMNFPVLKLSSLYDNPPYLPFQSEGNWNTLSTASPNLSQIGNLLLNHLDTEKGPQKIKVHLISDYQWSQFQFYQSATQKISWQFHLPKQIEPALNLSIRNVEPGNAGLEGFQLSAEVFGFFPQKSEIQLNVTQKGQQIGTQKFQWQGLHVQKLKLQLDQKFERLAPFEVSIQTDHSENKLDNIRYYQLNRSGQLHVSIITSEGNTAIYRHGLHQLKSALNANQAFSFLSSEPEHLKQHRPDVITLLGDHPIRWAESLQEYPSKLFIPTRLGDWKNVSEQRSNSSENETSPNFFPAEQWIIDWNKVPFAAEWKIKKINEPLFYSQTYNLWLLATGISPAWGPLYKDVIFADEIQNWIKFIMDQENEKFLGTFEAGSALPAVISSQAERSQWLPGHYRIKKDSDQSTYYFSINLPVSESMPQYMDSEKVQLMQDYFDHQSEVQSEQINTLSVNQIREWLLWFVLGLMFVEVIFLCGRIFKNNGRMNGKHSFY